MSGVVCILTNRQLLHMQDVAAYWCPHCKKKIDYELAMTGVINDGTHISIPYGRSDRPKTQYGPSPEDREKFAGAVSLSDDIEGAVSLDEDP